MAEDKTAMQILEVFSDGRSHSLEAVANKLKLSYNTTLQCLRKLEDQGKLYRLGSNRCYKSAKDLNLQGNTRGFKRSGRRIYLDPSINS